VTPAEAGAAYVEGRLSLDGLAEELGGDRADALAWLDARGLGRPLRLLALSPADTADRLARIRAERLRGPRPHDPSLVARSVVASMRLAGVDVRAWARSR